jgi:hypothetical protein
MNYKGKLYGKIAGQYFDTGKTADDYDEAIKVIRNLIDGCLNKVDSTPISDELFHAEQVYKKATE